MKKLLKWFLVAVGSVLGLALLSLAVIHVYMGQRLAMVHEVDGSGVNVPTDPDSVAEGERLARIRGCMGGCHGKETEGNVFFEVPDGTRVIAPDLGTLAAHYSNNELELAIRHGVKADGTSVLGIMPSSMFRGLSDKDFGAILAFLVTRRPGDEALPPTRLGPIVRAMLLYYSWQLDWSILPAETIDHVAPHPDEIAADAPGSGEYLAQTVCTECHGDDLKGSSDGTIPSLAIAVAYSREDFGTLMRTGRPVGGRELGLMKEVSLNRFAYFTETEIDSLHAYLQTLTAPN